MYKNKSQNLLLTYFVLNFIGLLMVYSSTFKINIAQGKNGFSSLLFQCVAMLFVIIVSITLINLEKKIKITSIFNDNIYNFFWISIGFLVAVLTPLGQAMGGSKSVIHVFIIDFQPLELYKITMILYLAKWLNNNQKAELKDFLINAIGIPFIGIFLILIEPDYGGAFILIILLGCMLLINGRFLKILFSFAGIIFASALIYLFFFSYGYQLERLKTFINPLANLSGDGNNILQSFISISNGGLFGVGYTNSLQKTGYLFGSNTDFIFSIIAEEFGMLGVLVTIGTLIWLAFQIYSIGRKSNLLFEYYVCMGISSLLLIQTAVNIGGVTGVIPMTGVTLPFISYGFNSYLFLSLGVLYVYIIATKTEKKKLKVSK